MAPQASLPLWPFSRLEPLGSARRQEVDLVVRGALDDRGPGLSVLGDPEKAAAIGLLEPLTLIQDPRTASTGTRGVPLRWPSQEGIPGPVKSSPPGTRQRHPSGRTGALAQFGRVGWHSSGRPKGPDSRAELSLSVVECHLGWLNRAIWPLRRQHRSELGDLNVIIQVEEWHSSDRLHGTVRAPRSAQIRALKCRWVSLGVTWGVPRGALDIVAGQKTA